MLRRDLSITKTVKQWYRIDAFDQPDMDMSASNSCPPAVVVNDLCFSYEASVPVLKNVNMCIPVTSIYGLLGPSGCGKTTILKCIVNTVTPHSGTVTTFGHRLPSTKINIPGPAVGYMPQEISLYDDLSVEEFLKYFATLNLIREPLLTERCNEIIEVLDLKSCIGLIKNLSGGQKRRVSFAATLIHKPLLAILDEPTVGVDPILRHNIWKHLSMLSRRDGMTIVITTHYVEEALNANVIAFMRKGRIIAEDTPKALISLCNGGTLEDAFLYYCHQGAKQVVNEERTSVAQETRVIPNNIKDKLEKSKGFSRKTYEWITMFSILYWKFHIRYVRNPGVIIFFFAFPLVVVIFASICIGKSVFGVPIGVVNLEAPENFSTKFINAIDDNYFVIREFETFSEAMRATKKGEIWGFIYIRELFTEALLSRTAIDNDIKNQTIEDSVIRIYADITNAAKTISIQRHLDRYYVKFVRDILESFGLNPSLAALPVVIGDAVYGFDSVDPLNREFIICGVLVMITFVSNCSFTAAVLILERESNMFERHFVAGVTTSQIFIASFTHKISTIAIQTIFLVFAIMTIYDFEWHPTTFWAIVILFLGQISGLSMGLLFSSVFDQLYNLAIVVTAFSLCTLCTGGVAWPLESIPYWMRWLSELQPTCLPAVGLRSVLMKQYGIDHKHVQSAIFISMTYIVVCFFLGNKFFRYKK